MRACSLDRLIYLVLHRLGRMGEDDAEYFRKTIKPGMSVVEAGSNLGLYTLLFSNLVGPTGSVHACEPDPRLAAALKTNVERNRALNIHVHQCAVGARSEQRTLRRGGLNSGDNRLEATEDAAGEAGPESVPVEVRSLNELMQGERVDFIKIDVQGWEAEVFRGLGHLAQANPNIQVYFEYWPHGLRGAGCEPQAWLNRLKDDGWILHSMPEGGPLRSEEIDALEGTRNYCNLLATRANG
jgi:FkbM family methyltransferase